MTAVGQFLPSSGQPPHPTELMPRDSSAIVRNPWNADPKILTDDTDAPHRGSEQLMPPNSATRTPIIIYQPGQDHIVSEVAKVLGKSVSRRSHIREVTGHDVRSVFGIPGLGVTADAIPRDKSYLLTINAHCVDLGMPPDAALSAACDHEFLYYEKSPHLRRDLARFLCFILGQSDHHERLMAKPRTYFISTTFPDVRAALPNIDILTVGCDAVELRVDLLQEPLEQGKFADIPSLGYVGEQLCLLRQRTELPIIFTTRSTDFSNGRFPTDDHDIYYKYLSRAVQWGVEYIDVELWLPENVRHTLFKERHHSRIMSAFHDFSGTFRWQSDLAAETFRRSIPYADIIKMIATAHDQAANFELEYFRSTMRSEYPTAPPLSAVNMGEIGHLSRALNKVFTPVTHALLPLVAAPGQMSIAQTNSSLASLGQLRKKAIYGVNKSQHRHPLTLTYFYRKCFNELGLPYQFEVLQHQQGNKKQVLEFLRADEHFGGACLDSGWTVATLLSACPTLARTNEGDGPELSDAVKAIGVVDTVVVHEAPRSGSASASASERVNPQQREADDTTASGNDAHSMRLIFDNMSWRGVLKVLTMDFAPLAYHGRSAVLLSASANEAAAALLAMKTLGISRVYTVGFKTPDVLAMASPPIDHVVDFESLQRARAVTGDSHPMLIVSALSTDRRNIVGMVLRAFAEGQPQDMSTKQRVFLDLADHEDSVGNGPRLVAASSGFMTYGAEEVGAFATVERLRRLVGQNVPYSFVRLAS